MNFTISRLIKQYFAQNLIFSDELEYFSMERFLNITFNSDNDGAIVSTKSVVCDAPIFGPVGKVHVVQTEAGINYVILIRKRDPGVRRIQGQAVLDPHNAGSWPAMHNAF